MTSAAAEPERPLSHDPACMHCGHDHHFLDCDWCPCRRHDRPGLYDD